MLFFNILFTSLPVICTGLFEKDLHEYIIAKNPPIYKSMKNLTFFGKEKKTNFLIRIFFLFLIPLGLLEWMAYAIFHSIVVFVVCYLVIQDGFVLPTGLTTGLREWGVMVMSTAFLTVIWKQLLET